MDEEEKIQNRLGVNSFVAITESQTIHEGRKVKPSMRESQTIHKGKLNHP
jgi:hypothetical protein